MPVPTAIKFFSHTKRDAHFAREAMEDLKDTGFRQMRLVSQFEIVNQALVAALILSVSGAEGDVRTALASGRGAEEDSDIV